MKTSLKSLAAGVLIAAAAVAAPAQAAVVTFDFSLNGNSRANGSFEYSDTKTGQLTFEDLESFTLTTVGGAIELADGTSRDFPSFTYSLTDVLGMSNRYFGFDATARMLAAGTFEGFDFPLVFAAYDDTASNGFLIDFYANNSGGGSVTDFAGGYQDGYDGISLTASVPEPASWALMLAGFAMVAGATRYRRRAPRVAYS
jgi:hypothetical protein